MGQVGQKQHPGFCGGGYDAYHRSEMAADGRNARLEMADTQLGTPSQYKPSAYTDVRHELG